MKMDEICKTQLCVKCKDNKGGKQIQQSAQQYLLPFEQLLVSHFTIVVSNQMEEPRVCSYNWHTKKPSISTSMEILKKKHQKGALSNLNVLSFLCFDIQV